MRHQVVIIGSGYTAKSAAFHLFKHGLKDIQLIAGGENKQNCSGETTLPAKAIISTYFDQITRIDHACGSASMHRLITLANNAYQYLKTFIEQNGLPYLEGPVKRIASTGPEKEELNQAYPLYQLTGLNPRKIVDKERSIHYTGEHTLSLDEKRLLGCLSVNLKHPQLNSKVVSLIEHEDHIEITTKSGKKIEAEIAILGCHADIGALLPFYQNVLIPYSDQWNEAIVSESFLQPGEMALLKFSNLWVKSTAAYEIVFGGARFMRPHAGIGHKISTAEAAISGYIANELKNHFSVSIGQITKGYGCVGVRACDEIPVIGPHFGSGRILIGSGYMGNPIPMGLFAGKCLADIVATGRADLLPRDVSPERLRNLAKKG